MANIFFNDTHIDNLVWQAISASQCCKDFENYLELFMKPLHEAEACTKIEHLLHDSLSDNQAPACFSQVVTSLSSLASIDAAA